MWDCTIRYWLYTLEEQDGGAARRDVVRTGT